MSQRLRLNNFDSPNIKEKTSVDLDVSAASSALTVKSTDNIAVSDYIWIGTLGNEGTEKAQVASVSGFILTLVSPLTYAHKQYEDVTVVNADQIKIYRASNVDGSTPADTSFASIATINIDPDQTYTDYTDASGSNAYWYKFTYYNSTSTNESSLADSTAVRGGGYGHYASIDEIRREAGFTNNQNITDSMIDAKRSEVEREIDGYLYEEYTTPFTLPAPLQVTHATVLIAAGYLLLQEYGAVTSGTNKEGQQKVDQGWSILDMIKNRQIILASANGQSLLQTSGLGGWPDNTTNGLDESMAGDCGPYITRSHIW